MTAKSKWIKTCDNCGGDGVCPECGGSGEHQECGGDGCDECADSGACGDCDGDKRCIECGGDGKIECSKITPSPEFMRLYTSAKRYLEGSATSTPDAYALAVYMLRDFCEIKVVELDDLAWALATPQTEYTSKSDAIGFFEFVEQRIETVNLHKCGLNEPV